MRRVGWALVLVVLFASSVSVYASATPYRTEMRGDAAAFRLSGIEPDGDPIDQVILRTRLGGNPALPDSHLIIDAYLENFQPDTTPILPDLLHPSKKAINLGGFLEGKALLTDDAGNVILIGSFLAEAFFNNSNHTVMRLFGREGSALSVRGIFRLRRDGSIHGSLSGFVHLAGHIRRDFVNNRGAAMRPLKDIIKTVTVRPAPMRGRATRGTPGTPLHTGFGTSHSSSSRGVTDASPNRPIPALTWRAGIAAAGCLVIALGLFWRQRRFGAP